MTEQLRKNPDLNCYQFGHINDDEGKPILLDIIFPHEGRLYAITVGTAEMLRQIQRENESIEDPNLRIDDNIFVMDDLSDPDKVCQKLIRSPFEELEQFIRLQHEEKTSE